MSTKFFYRDIDLVYFVNNKLINGCTNTAYSLTQFRRNSIQIEDLSEVRELLTNPHISYTRASLTNRRFSLRVGGLGVTHTQATSSDKSLTLHYLNPLARQGNGMCGQHTLYTPSNAALVCKPEGTGGLATCNAYPVQALQVAKLTPYPEGVNTQAPKGVCKAQGLRLEDLACVFTPCKPEGTGGYGYWGVKHLINQKDRVLLSFSGGQDSICFVFILHQLHCQLELEITFFWCHHLWQTDSFYLMQQIAKLSFLFQFNSCFPIPLGCISNELLARKWRQSCSYRVSSFYNYSKICLAHTFNDKIENIFLNFIRGTGLIGLTPLRWVQLAKRISKPNIILNNFFANSVNSFRGKHNTNYPFILPSNANPHTLYTPSNAYPSGLPKGQLVCKPEGTGGYKSTSLNPLQVAELTPCKAQELRLEDLSEDLACVWGNGMCGLNKPLNKTWSKQLLDGCYIVRPLLSISRIELNKICYFWELPIYPDKSNQKVKFLRNRVRGQLLPTIKLFFNLNIENIFLQLAKIVETEDYCLTQIVNEFTKNTDVYYTKLNIYSKRRK